VRRISEQIQSDLVLMLRLKRIGIQPGRKVLLASSDGGVQVTCCDEAEPGLSGSGVSPGGPSGSGVSPGGKVELPRDIAAHVFVSRK
jgi:DtxR family Mn-dependent transcriptional regulator